MTAGDESQFIELPPGVTPVVSPRHEEHASSDECAPLIELPSGIFDSSTFRLSAPRVAKPERLSDAPPFFPAGSVTVAAPSVVAETVEPPVLGDASANAPETQPTRVITAAGTAEIDDATRVSTGRRSLAQWLIVLPSGETLALQRTTIVGRGPSSGATWPDAELLAIDDVAKSVSKTHAALEVTATGQLLVHDLNSTNGVFLQHPNDEEVAVQPGTALLVEAGSIVSFGEYSVTIQRP